MRRRSGRFFALLGGWRRRQNSGIFLCFCLLRGARGQLRWNSCESGGEGGVQRTLLRTRGGGQSTRRMLFASVHKQVSALRTSVQDWSSVYSRAGITNKLGMRHCIFMKQKSTSANSNALFKTIQNVCLACKETGPARLGEFHR